MRATLIAIATAALLATSGCSQPNGHVTVYPESSANSGPNGTPDPAHAEITGAVTAKCRAAVAEYNAAAAASVANQWMSAYRAADAAAALRKECTIRW